MQVGLETADGVIRGGGDPGRTRGAARDDERNACLVDQDRVRFVDHRRGERTQHLLMGVTRELIAQIVEADLVGGRVGDVESVGRSTLVAGRALLDRADRQPGPAIDLPHPRRVAAREVIVGGEDVDAPPAARVPDDGRDRSQRLALAGLHLRDAAVRQRERACSCTSNICTPSTRDATTAHAAITSGSAVAPRTASVSAGSFSA